MFDDSGRIADRQDRQARRLQAWIERFRRPVIVENGAGNDVRTVREFSQRTVLSYGSPLVRISLREPDIGPLQGEALASMRMRRRRYGAKRCRRGAGIVFCRSGLSHPLTSRCPGPAVRGDMFHARRAAIVAAAIT